MADNRIERKLTVDENGFYDYTIDSNGDFTHDESFDTDIVVSLFVDSRADSSEIFNPEDRRGWFGDVVSPLNNYLIGSKLWLLEQERLSQSTVNKAQTYAKDCLQWIIDKEYAQRVHVTAIREGLEAIIITIRIYVNSDKILKFTHKLWKESAYATT